MNLKVTFNESLHPVQADVWTRLFDQHPDPPQLIQLVAAHGIVGFKFCSLSVTHEDEPLLLLPLFVGNYPLATSLAGREKEIVSKLEPWLPALLRPKVLFVGFVEGEWGQVGINAGAGRRLIQMAWKRAIEELEKLAAKLKVSAIAFWNFPASAYNDLPLRLLSKYCTVQSQPFCRFTVRYQDLDSYFSSLDKDMGRYLKRVLKNGSGVSIERVREPGDLLDQIYSMYTALVARAEMTFGVQPKNYFRDICSLVPGAHYVLYRLGSQLIGFELLIESETVLVSKYFAMDPELGPQFKLYFLSWLDDVRYAIEKNIPEMHLGAAAEGLKAQLGAQVFPSAVLFKHRNPLLNSLFHKIKDDLAYDCQVPVDMGAFGVESTGVFDASAKAAAPQVVSRRT